MSGIYIHIPFCKQACSYCDFHFSTNQQLRKPLVDALCTEIALHKNELTQPAESLYFGGGSPSILNAEEFTQLFDALRAHIDMSQLKEITLESNPDDHSPEKLTLWKTHGINRLSIGIQSFIDRDLKLMNRAHDSEHAKSCVENARKAGFENLTIDLIYGIPGQSFKEWADNIEKALALNPDHISAYCLTIEEKTALHHRIKKGEVLEKEDSRIEQEFLYLHRTLKECGFVHYEISNFGRENKKALHNSNYWSGRPYLGFGPSAHSFDGRFVRRWNFAHNARYIKSIERSEPFWDEERLTEADRTNEQLMTALRTREGINLSALSSNMQSEIAKSLRELPDALKPMIEFDAPQLRVNPSHWLMTDALLRHLFIQT